MGLLLTETEARMIWGKVRSLSIISILFDSKADPGQSLPGRG